VVKLDNAYGPSNNMDCAYCGTPASSREHWFPESFGKFKGYELLSNRVCVGCNQATTLAEQALAQYGVTGFIRQRLAIQGKRRKKDRRSPFGWYLKDLPPQMLKMSYPGVPCRIFGELLPDGRMGPVRQLILKRGEEIFAAALPDWVKSPETLERFLSEMGLTSNNILKVAAAKDIAGKTLRELFPDRDPEPGETPPLPGKIHYEWTVATGVLHARAVSKIAFHYLLKYWGDSYSGREDEFHDIRDFIQGKYPHEIDWTRFAVRASRNKLLVRPSLGSPHHLLSLRRTANWIEGDIRFFEGVTEQMGPDIWKVRLGKPPGSVIWESSITHHFLLYPAHSGVWHGEFKEGFPSSTSQPS